MVYTIYEIASGKKIKGIHGSYDLALLNTGNDESFINQDFDGGSYYIIDGVVTLRPTPSTTLAKLILTANGIDFITIADTPSGTFTATNTVTKESVTGPISGTDSFYTTIPGTYKIIIEAWPYLDYEMTIEAI